MLSLYTPTGSNPASLTCMELTLKPLEALICKNVGLGPTEKAYFETSGSGASMPFVVTMLGFCPISCLPGLLIWLIGSMVEGHRGQIWHPLKGRLSQCCVLRHLPSTLTVPLRVGIRSREMGIPREMRCILSDLVFSMFFFLRGEGLPLRKWIQPT